MKYCKKCGTQMEDEANFCPSCGLGTGSNADEADYTRALLSFIIPIVGLILFFTTLGKSPKRASIYGLFAVIGAIVFTIIINITYGGIF